MAIELRQFAAGVDAEHLAGVRGAQGEHGLAVALQDRGDLGEVVLAVRIVGGELIDAGEQFGDVEGVDAGVDLADLLLLAAELLLLDDGFDLVGDAAVDDAAHDASVAEGIGRLGGEDGHGGRAGDVEIAHAGDGLRADERHVAAEHEDVIVGGQRFAALHQGVSGAALLALFDEPGAERGDLGADALGLMADDAEDIGGRDDLAGGADDMAEQWASGDLVQHLGQLRLEARALAGGENGDGKSWFGMRLYCKAIGHWQWIWTRVICTYL